MARPGSSIDTNDFFTDTDVLDILQRSTNPAVSTIYYDSANPSGYQCSCDDAYANIASTFGGMAENSGTNLKFWIERCEKSGYFDYAGAQGESAHIICRDKALNFLALYMTPGDSLNLMRQYLVSNQIYNYIKQNNVDQLTDFKIMSSLRGEAGAAVKWVPILKSAVFTTYIGLTPFLFMLIPTLAFARVLQFILGIFVFMTSWDICDALLHSYSMDMAIATFREIIDHGISLKTLWMMEGESIEALMIFGKMRWVSMILASTVSVVLARFGGLAIAHVAQMLNVSGYGAAASRDVVDPIQRSEQLKRLPNVMPTEAITNAHGFNAMAANQWYEMQTPIVGNALTMQRLGGPRACGGSGGACHRRMISCGASRAWLPSAIPLPQGERQPRACFTIRPGVRLKDRRAGRQQTETTGSLTGDTAAYGSLGEKATYLKKPCPGRYQVDRCNF